MSPGVHAAVVKTALSRFAADSMHPAQARDLIRQQATAAIKSLANAQPPSIGLPATLQVRFRNADLAEMATWISGVERAGQVQVSISDDDPVRLFRAFIAAVVLTRGIGE